MVTAILSPNGRKARYGVSYLRSLCAQAGVGLTESSPDEDVLATDCDVKFAQGIVSVQVKCTSQFTIGGNSASWPVEETWLRKWDEILNPVYFLLVLVPADCGDWLDHDDAGTMHRTAAFWRRIKPEEITTSISVSKSQRLTVDTFDTWRADLLVGYNADGTS